MSDVLTLTRSKVKVRRRWKLEIFVLQHDMANPVLKMPLSQNRQPANRQKFFWCTVWFESWSDTTKRLLEWGVRTNPPGCVHAGPWNTHGVSLRRRNAVKYTTVMYGGFNLEPNQAAEETNHTSYSSKRSTVITWVIAMVAYWSVGLVWECGRTLGTIIHSSYEPGVLWEWLCHCRDDGTVNNVPGMNLKCIIKIDWLLDLSLIINYLNLRTHACVVEFSHVWMTSRLLIAFSAHDNTSCWEYYN